MMKSEFQGPGSTLGVMVVVVVFLVALWIGAL